MRLISSLLIIAIMFGACASKKDSRTVIENYFKSKATDYKLSDYHVDEIKLIDTMRDADRYKFWLKTDQYALTRDSASHDTAAMKQDIVLLQKVQHKMDSVITANPGAHAVLQYLVKISGKDLLGVQVIKSYHVFLNDTLAVTGIVKQ